MHTLPSAPPTQDPLTGAPAPTVGLRLRLWAACFAGTLVGGLGGLWVYGALWVPGESDASFLVPALAAVGGAAALAAFAAALWLDHHVVSHLRGVLRGLHTGRTADLRGLPAAHGWGELSQLSESTQIVLAHVRRTSRAAEDMETTRHQLVALRGALERWLATERWQAPSFEVGEPAALAAVLDRGIGRTGQVTEQHREVARQIASELVVTLGDAQESAEQAERGFVEATALLTTVRELQRLSLELQNALVQVTPAAPEPAAAPMDDRFREAARAALEELVAGSTESVESISSSLMHVQDIASHVQRLGNRATLIAIHAVVGGTRVEGDTLTGELRQLAADVREATERTSDLARDIEQEVAHAAERMRTVRERALARFEQVAVPAPAAPERRAPERRTWDDAQRLLERVREMVQDAASKGERLSAAGERASRAAERLARRLEEETRDAEALAARLEPVGEAPRAAAGEAAPGLRVLEPGDAEAATEAASDDEHDGNAPASDQSPGESR